MAGEAARDGGGGEVADLMERFEGVVRDANRVMAAVGGATPPQDVRPMLAELAGIESELKWRGADFGQVFLFRGLLLGHWCLGLGADRPAGPQPRAEALRRLRWADRSGPSDHPLVRLARMMLVALLAPWTLPRPDGTRTVLHQALLAVGDGGVLTESARRDLMEAREVVDRAIAAGSEDADHRRELVRVGQAIQRMLGDSGSDSGSGSPSPSAGGGSATVDAVEDPEAVLLDVVRDIVALAASYSTPRFTRLLVWLVLTLRGDDTDQKASVLHDPATLELLRRVAAGAAAGAAGVRRGAELALRARETLPHGVPERARVARLHAHLLLTADTLEPGSVAFDAVERPAEQPDPPARRLAEWPVGVAVAPGLAAHLDSRLRDFTARLGIRERRTAARFHRLLAYRTGDPGYLDDAASLLGDAIEAVPDDSWWALTLRSDLADVLRHAAGSSGSSDDADTARAELRRLRAGVAREGSVSQDAPFAVELALRAATLELEYALRTDDLAALPALVEELEARHAALPPENSQRARLARELDKLRAASTPRASQRPPQHPLTASGVRPLPAFPPWLWQPRAAGFTPPDRAELDREVTELRRRLGEPPRFADERYVLRTTLGMTLLQAVIRGDDDPALLDEAIAELTRVRVMIAEGRGGAYRPDVLTKLAEAHLIRGARRRRAADGLAFVELTREALGELASEVLLQAGTDHRLSAALNGSVLARRLAVSALVLQRPDDALEALERGRALVLQAASSARTVPELLDAAGHTDLAARWRAQVRTDPPGSAPSGDTVVPSALRRQALAALGAAGGAGRPSPGLVEIADAAGVAAGLAATGTDALVYLVPGEQRKPGPSFPGRALVIRPGATTPEVVLLPELLIQGSPPLERYLDAAAERSRAMADPTLDASRRADRDRRWGAALGELCDWAWLAAMGPLLTALGPYARPPRLVLVPCGRLGLVPWHAARSPGADGQGGRYVCQEAVVSYAPSGAQFLRAARRRRRPPGEQRRVLVTDPSMTLLWAEAETTALRTGCYPDALRYGMVLEPGERPDAAGTPSDLLAVLPGGGEAASVVHLACHASSSPRSTRSALRLAVPSNAARDQAYYQDEDQDAGRLTVADILDDAAAAGQPPDAAGPLVVLSACETDLSTRGHDEALTLATALAAGGAADVVGSRWAVQDSATAVMMVVFHHHLTVGGLAPPDALRAAQLWMLDPHRQAIPTLSGPLRHEATRPDLHHVRHWAAFTHQGNPTAATDH
ncbi:CHAT domain-containing protein [Streptomyces mayteni]